LKRLGWRVAASTREGIVPETENTPIAVGKTKLLQWSIPTIAKRLGVFFKGDFY